MGMTLIVLGTAVLAFRIGFFYGKEEGLRMVIAKAYRGKR
jgi:hypothetical protein